MTPSTTLVILFFLTTLSALAYGSDLERDQILEIDQVLQGVRNMSDLQERFDEIHREGHRAVITVGILPLLVRTENIEHFLERHEDFGGGFGGFARMVVYFADLYLSHGK